MKKRNRSFSLLLFILLLLLLPLHRIEAREQVGVLDFTGNVRREFLSSASQRLTHILLNLDRFIVLDRLLMGPILEEQHFQQTGLVDVSTAVVAGKLLGIQLAFIGHIQDLTTSYEKGIYRGQTTIIIHIIQVETGTLLHSLTLQGTATHTNRTIVSHRAIESAMGQELIIELREIFPLTSYITHVEGDRIYMIGGEDIGVKRGYRYWIKKPHPFLFTEGDFYRRIGLLEIVEVTPSRSRGRLLYSTEPVEKNHIVQEVPYQTRNILTLGLKNLNYNLDYSRYKGTTPLLEMSYIIERTFLYSILFSGRYAYFQGLSYFNLSIGGELERPIVPGQLYITFGGSIGVQGAVQRHPPYTINWRDYPGGLATAGSPYLSGSSGMKYYLNYDEGVSLHLGVGGQYGGQLHSWLDEREYDVTSLLPYKTVNTDGFFISLSLRLPLQWSHSP